MGQLKKISFKIMKKNTSLTIACCTSIMITVFLVISMINYSLNIKTNYREKLLEKAGGFDIMIMGDKEDEITEEVVKKVTKDKMVKSYTGGLSQFITINGEQIYGFGLEDNRITRTSYGYTYKLEEDVIVLNNIAAELLHLKLEDLVQFHKAKFHLKEIVELQKYTEEKMPIAILKLSAFRTIFDREEGYDFLAIKLKDSNQVENTITKLNEQYPTLQVTSTYQVSEMKSIEKIVSNYLIFLSGLVIFISSLLISSIYYSYLKKSHKIINTLRMVGANSSNIYEIMLYQTILMNGIGCTFGFALAFLCYKPLIEWYGKKGGWINQAVTFHYLISILVILIIFGLMQLFMLHFLKKIIANLPNIGEKELNNRVKENYESSSDYRKTKKKKMSGRMAFFLFTIGYYIFNVIQILLYHAVLPSMLLCLFLSFILLYLYSKDIIKWILIGIERLCKKLRFIHGFIAKQLIFPHMKENIYIILTIMFLFIFSLVGNNFFRMIESNSKSYYKNYYLLDIAMVPSTNNFLALETGLKIERSLEAKNIKHISFQYYPDIYTYHNGNILPSIVKGTSFEKLTKEELLKKEISKEAAVISGNFAKRYDVKTGDTLNLVGYKNLVRDAKGRLTLSNNNESYMKQFIVEEISNITAFDILLDNESDFLDQAEYKLFDCIFLSENSAMDKNEFYSILTEISYRYGTKWSAYHEKLKSEEKIAKEEIQLLSICINTLFLFICFGMLNSLNNILFSRRKEYRVLRQLGVRRGNIVKIMVIQIVTYCSIGIILGVLFGCFVISTINFIDLRSFRLQISLKEVMLLIGVLFLFTLGTIPTMRKLIKE